MQSISLLIYRCFYTLQFLTLFDFSALSENVIIEKARGRSLELLGIHMHISKAVLQRCSVKKGVFRNFTKFTGKHLCQSLFLVKLQESCQTSKIVCFTKILDGFWLFTIFVKQCISDVWRSFEYPSK